MDHRRTPGAGDGSPACDGTQPYDSNEGPADAPGWLCRDQIGAGYDVTPYDGTLPFSAQYKSPMYSWDNGDTTVYVVSGHTAIIKADRDWYNHSAAAGSPQTTGVRVGTKANMPAGCAPGVGYWVTNEGYWDTTTPGVADGQLYKCTAPNTWTLYYIPYTYPHPLRSGVDPLPDPIPDPIPDAPAGTLRGISFGGVTW